LATSLKLSYCPYFLQFRHPFGLSHISRTETPTVYVKLEKNDKTGYGEATLPPYLGETQESVIHFLKKAAHLLDTNFDLAKIPQIDSLTPGNSAAKAALDIALHDLFGKLANKPAFELLSFPKPPAKETSVTIGIGDLSLIPQKLEELKDFHLIKVKLGNPNDREIIEAIRKVTDKPLVVDVNQGWPQKDFALEMIQWLSKRNVEYVEQPLAKENYVDSRWLKERSSLPVVADESFQRYTDLQKIDENFSGLNLKLMKCTGLQEGAKIILAAREKKLKINIGCMSESSCGIAAASQLMHYADWIDLDGPMLIKNDPFGGVTFKDGKLNPAAAPGTGAVLLADLSFQPIN
jgi:L-alanine-DL-glutamate epimerase-like enolase superfamily enzyme